MKLYIARNCNNTLVLFRDKPVYYNGYWINGYALYTHCSVLDDTLFPEITPENSPKLIELKLIENDNK